MKIKKTPTTVLVLGGHGFIGRHVVQAIRQMGAKALIGTRNHPRRDLKLNERELRLHQLNKCSNWEDMLEGIDVLVNAVGILRQRPGESYTQVHHLAVVDIAKACARRDIRFVHISALGLENPVRSRFLKSKLEGEKALAKLPTDWYIVRPSLVEGPGGYGAKWFRRIALWPIHFAPRNATSDIAPIRANELGAAIAVIALRSRSPKSIEQRYIELGGAHQFNLFGYLEKLAESKTKRRTKAIKLRLPCWLARSVAHLCDLFHITPFSFGHYELLQYENVPKNNQLYALLRTARKTKAGAFTNSHTPFSNCTIAQHAS